MIRVDQDGPVWTLTLDRPDKANALTGDMLAAIAETATEAATEAHVLILTGQGRVFSAGADLEQMGQGLATDPVWEWASGALAAFPGLSIAALNGTLAGGSFGIALAADLRIAAPQAAFFYPVMRLGFLPQPSDPGRLAALIGPARAKMILMAGQKIGAETARDWGLIDEIAEEPLARARALAEDAAAADRHHAAAIKALLPRP